MKIAEAEERIRRDGLTQTNLDLFSTALKRVPKPNRCRHCYALAMELPRARHRDAVALLQLGLDNYAASWSDAMFSWQNLAVLREADADYAGALDAYRQALAAIPKDLRGNYPSEFAAHMLRCELHRAGFRPTENLREYYTLSLEQGDFAATMLHKQFYRALAEMVLFRGTAQAEEVCARARAMAKPGFEGPLTRLLRRNRFEETTRATPQALHFLATWPKA